MVETATAIDSSASTRVSQPLPGSYKREFPSEKIPYVESNKPRLTILLKGALMTTVDSMQELENLRRAINISRLFFALASVRKHLHTGHIRRFPEVRDILYPLEESVWHRLILCLEMQSR